jgi:hypothetical protein
MMRYVSVLNPRHKSISAQLADEQPLFEKFHLFENTCTRKQAVIGAYKTAVITPFTNCY